MNRPARVCGAAAALLLCVSLAASADEVRFKNGDRLTGKITSAEGGRSARTSTEYWADRSNRESVMAAPPIAWPGPRAWGW